MGGGARRNSGGAQAECGGRGRSPTHHAVNVVHWREVYDEEDEARYALYLGPGSRLDDGLVDLVLERSHVGEIEWSIWGKSMKAGAEWAARPIKGVILL